ncbi:MAG: DUF4159 domain-containing protein [Albidovulum sp.]
MTGLFAALGFSTPWLLWALLALPVIWILLRVVPPAAVLRRFPGVVLLLGLADTETAAARTPPWLLMLRILALALVILGFAGPVLNPDARAPGVGPVLILADASWADAGDWAKKRARLSLALQEARRDGRRVALVTLTATGVAEVQFTDGADLAARLAALEPAAWEPEAQMMADLATSLPDEDFETLWVTDGLARPGREALLQALGTHGPITVYAGASNLLGLRPAEIKDGKVVSTVLRPHHDDALNPTVLAIGLDPAGVEREIARETLTLAPGEATGEVAFDLPPELRNRLTRLMIADQNSAGAVALAGDVLKRRKVALIEGGGAREGLQLLSPGHYLREALRPSTDVIEGNLTELLPAAPQVVILADVGRLSPDEAKALTEWVNDGGLLLRFAGPRLAATIGFDGVADPLLPVRLRPGGRSVGGTMSWGEAREIAPFPEGSPFHGLQIPEDVKINAQVLAEPGPQLADHTIAALTDGTPLVTRAGLGKGQVVLFHVTASAEWSGLPLSGLFVEMLDRMAISSNPNRAKPEDLLGTTWVAEQVMDAYGALTPADALAGVAGERLGGGKVAADMPPGLYASGDQRLALSVIGAKRSLDAAPWPSGVAVEGLDQLPELPLKGWLLASALGLCLMDIFATLLVSGRLAGRRASGQMSRAAMVLLLACALPMAPSPGHAQGPEDDQRLIDAAGGMVLAHILTGDARTDEVAAAGLAGLSQVMFARTSVEPSDPVGVNLETDELSVFAFLYWPVTADQPTPSPAAYVKLNRFLQTGGMILFDTRDADLSGGTQITPEGQRLQQLAAALDIPPLELVPADHVLTRSFYLLQDFPGRYAGQMIWVEAAPPGAELAEGMPFRNLNDGVTPVVFGGNDWAAAWAIDQSGNPMFPVGRGMGGERQRELAYRFGVNLIMYVLTGNYKSDQVHVPALLERLGQ